LEFVVGSGQIISGFENAVIGMKRNQEKKIKLKPADAYGERNEALVQTVPGDVFKDKKKELKKDMMLVLKDPNGKVLPATIIKVDEKSITIDLNHPLAGKNLNFKIKVVEIVK